MNRDLAGKDQGIIDRFAYAIPLEGLGITPKGLGITPATPRAASDCVLTGMSTAFARRGSRV